MLRWPHPNAESPLLPLTQLSDLFIADHHQYVILIQAFKSNNQTFVFSISTFILHFITSHFVIFISNIINFENQSFCDDTIKFIIFPDFQSREAYIKYVINKSRFHSSGVLGFWGDRKSVV